MRPRQRARAAAPAAADDVRDAVDLGLEAGVSQAPREPMPRGDIVGRQGWTVHAGFVAAEFGKALEIADKPAGIDLWHPLSPVNRAVGLGECRPTICCS